jgi:hypothetical protein
MRQLTPRYHHDLVNLSLRLAMAMEQRLFNLTGPDWQVLGYSAVSYSPTLAPAMPCHYMAHSSQMSREPCTLGDGKYSFRLAGRYFGLARTLALPVHMRRKSSAARRGVCKKATLC